MNPVNNITELFFIQAKANPNKTAIIEGDKKISFAELAKSVKQTAAYFLNKGIVKGDRVMVFVPMGIDLYRNVLALFYIGATAVFLDEWVGVKRMRECCKVANCKGFIGIFKARVIGFFIPEIRRISIHLLPNKKHLSTDIKVAATLPHATALITFTTGSTGTPKAAKRTHSFLFEQFRILVDELKPDNETIDMPVLPIVLLINLGTGVTSVIADFKASKPDSLKPAKILHQINQHKVNRIIASPFFVKQLAKYLIAENKSTATLQKIFTGGAPVFPSEAALYKKAFPDTTINVVYGSTESEPISLINVNQLVKEELGLNTGLNVGRINPEVKLKIIPITMAAIQLASEDELNAIELKSPEIGEIIVTGPHVLKEYYNSEAAFKQNKIRVADVTWHRTGDSGYLNQDGTLYLTGRCNSIMYHNNKMYAPFIYENLLQSIEGIELATLLKQNNKLVVIAELTVNGDKKIVQEEILKLKINVDDILFIEKMPRDPRHNSKIDYAKLEKQME